MSEQEFNEMMDKPYEGIWVDTEYGPRHYIYAKDYIDIGDRDADVYSVEEYDKDGNQLRYEFVPCVPNGRKEFKKLCLGL